MSADFQNTNTVLMVRPASFRMNEQTAVNNYYQKGGSERNQDLCKKAIEEFDALVLKLKQVGINVVVYQDKPVPETPDALFPNNWVSFHSDGRVALYPMFAENRRSERDEEVLDLIESSGFSIDHLVDYSSAEQEQVFLEGTGSLVLDRVHKKAYCALSPRSDEDLCIEFCEDFGYMPILFNAYQTVNNARLPIYHTNVMMSVCDTFALVCLEAIDSKSERKMVLASLADDGKEVISISEDQVSNFVGNALQVLGTNHKKHLVMSTRAYRSLSAQQKDKIEAHCTIVHSSINTIETYGGGSSRCMLAEVFLPKAL